VNVLVIGAGFAGLSAATALAARGYPVRVLDAADEVGGKAQAIDAAGARVDLGPTILTDLEPLGRLFAAGGATLEQAISLVRLDPALVATFAGEAVLPLHADPGAMARALAALGPSARDDWDRMLALGARAARLSAHYYARGDVRGTGDLLRFVLGGHARLDDVVPFVRRRSLAGLLDAHVRTPELRELLGHCARFLGLDADRAPAVALVIPHLFATTGIWYPLGGIASLARAVRDLATKRGAEIETGISVARLELAGDRVAAAITVDGRRIPADACIAAVDARVSARWLARDAGPRRDEPTYAARVAWWVMDGAPRRAVHHAFHFASGHEHPVYLSVPTVTDSTLAPTGTSVVHALLHGRPGAPADLAFADDVRARLVRAVAWPTGRILAQGVAGGEASCYGGAIGPGLFAGFRPSQRVPRVANLLRAGGSVFPGPGLANVIRSGLRAADMACAGARS
jgi:phytoene dehydrogenase-like protein